MDLYLRGLTSEILSFYPSDFMKKYLPRAAGPGFYTEIGRKSRDLLFEDYRFSSKISLDKYPFSASLMTHALPTSNLFTRMFPQISHLTPILLLRSSSCMVMLLSKQA
ncbi:hypothetical protein YC2023_080942 [Brassica napus]|uniref:(rape) hypothetical protein n=1 Tax=Brassica napus TaxID=3708 RepID=A0A816QUQ8_BRANA|nr:unnamed protein product [Brassica napus]